METMMLLLLLCMANMMLFNGAGSVWQNSAPHQSCRSMQPQMLAMAACRANSSMLDMGQEAMDASQPQQSAIRRQACLNPGLIRPRTLLVTLALDPIGRTSVQPGQSQHGGDMCAGGLAVGYSQLNAATVACPTGSCLAVMCATLPDRSSWWA